MRASALSLAFVVALAGACASGPREDPYVVIEENSYIPDRSLVRSVSIIDDDVLLVRSGARDIHRVRLFPGCADFADVNTAARLEETGMGIDRGTRFIIGGSLCPVRSIDKVEERRILEARRQIPPQHAP